MGEEHAWPGCIAGHASSLSDVTVKAAVTAGAVAAAAGTRASLKAVRFFRSSVCLGMSARAARECFPGLAALPRSGRIGEFRESLAAAAAKRLGSQGGPPPPTAARPPPGGDERRQSIWLLLSIFRMFLSVFKAQQLPNLPNFHRTTLCQAPRRSLGASHGPPPVLQCLLPDDLAARIGK